MSGLDALSPEERDVLAVWNAHQAALASIRLEREWIEHPENRRRELEFAKASVEKSLARLTRLLWEPK